MLVYSLFVGIVQSLGDAKLAQLVYKSIAFTIEILIVPNAMSHAVSPVLWKLTSYYSEVGRAIALPPNPPFPPSTDERSKESEKAKRDEQAKNKQKMTATNKTKATTTTTLFHIRNIESARTLNLTHRQTNEFNNIQSNGTIPLPIRVLKYISACSGFYHWIVDCIR